MTHHIAEVVLVCLYTGLAAYVLGQIVVLLKQRHKPFSYKAVFNWFALAWMLIRALFWILFIADDAFGDDTEAIFWVLFWLPHSIIYMTFATLALFLNKVIKRRNWTQKYRTRFLIAYTVFGAVDVIGTLVLSVLAGNADDANVEGNWESGGSGVLFFLLGTVYLYLGWRMRKLSAWEYNRMFVFQPATISKVVFLLAFIFMSRCVFNFLTMAGVVSVDIEKDTVSTNAWILTLYGVWEFFPLILLLTTVAAGPTGSGYTAIPKETLSFGVFGAIDAMEAEGEALGLGRDGDLDGLGMGMGMGMGMDGMHLDMHLAPGSEGDGNGAGGGVHDAAAIAPAPGSPVGMGMGMSVPPPFDYAAMGGAAGGSDGDGGGGDSQHAQAQPVPFGHASARARNLSSGVPTPGLGGGASGSHGHSHSHSHGHSYRSSGVGGAGAGFGSPGGLVFGGGLAGLSGNGTPMSAGAGLGLGGFGGASASASAAASMGGGPGSVGLGAAGGLGRPGGFTAHTMAMHAMAMGRVSSAEDGEAEPGSHRGGSQSSTRSALSLGAGGFLAAQQNAMRRSGAAGYQPPSYGGPGSVGGGPRSSMSTGAGGSGSASNTPIFSGRAGPGAVAGGGAASTAGLRSPVGPGAFADPHGMGMGMGGGMGMGMGMGGGLFGAALSPLPGEELEGEGEGEEIDASLASHGTPVANFLGAR